MAKRKLPHSLEPEHVQAMMDACNVETITGLRLRVVLELLYHAGVRNRELRMLRPGDVHMTRGLLSISLGAKGGWERTVPLLAETVIWLRQWEKVRPASKWLVSTLRGSMLGGRWMQQAVKRIAQRANLGQIRVHPHAFRHTYATECLRRGMNLRQVQELLGHANVETTQIYTHIALPELSDGFRRAWGKEAG